MASLRSNRLALHGREWPKYTHLYVVSDLHLASTPLDEQIFKGAEELAALVAHAAERRRDAPEARVGFVINGDFIDFLADRNPSYFDPGNAVSKLRDVIAQFSDLWAAFKDFVREGNDLIIVLGNHDLELALEHVQRFLKESIADTPAEAQRVHLHMDGSGFAALVGDARVLCLHGNEVDPFNVVDYERLREVQREVQHGWASGPWIPNAGTKMVIDVMNGIKRDLPFVDLLKPETEAVVPILFALDQASEERLRGVLAVAGRAGWDKFRLWTGLLAAEGSAEDARAEPRHVAAQQTRRSPLDALLSTSLPSSARGANARSAGQALLMDVEVLFEAERDPLDIVQGQSSETLGYGSALWKKLRGASKEDVLLEAIEKVQKDQSFDPLALDETFRSLDDLVPPEVDYLIAGHTHLARTLNRKSGAGRYFNTGTWARLIRLRPDDLISRERFAPVFQMLRAKTMRVLEAAGARRVVHVPTCASVWLEGNETRGELHLVELDARGNATLKPFK